MPRRTRFLASAEAQAQERSKALAPRTFRQHVDADDQAPVDSGSGGGGGDADSVAQWSEPPSRSVSASPWESPRQSRASLRLPVPGAATAALDAALSLAPTPPVPSSPSVNGSYLAFGSRSPSRAKVERAEQPPVALRRFSLEVDGPSSPISRSAVPLPPAAPSSFGPDGDSLFDYSELDDAEQSDGGAGDSAQAHLDALMSQRRSTFLTGLDLGTQMHLMRAHYRSYATGGAEVKLHRTGGGESAAQDPAVAQPAELPGGGGGSGSRTARSSRRASLSAGDIDGGEEPAAAGSQSARPATTHPGDRKAKKKKLPRSSRHSAGTVLHHHSSGASSSTAAWPSAVTGGSGMGVGGVGSGGAKAQVFNAASERFPPSEKAELGLHNAVSLYTTLPRELCPATIQMSSKLLLKYRLPRSSELESEVFVRALPGMHGLPLRSPHGEAEGGGFVSALPRRNLFLLNPSSLDPITPGPGAYMGLVRAQYEKEKVAQLGGVMRTVTATNGILRTRLRAQDEALAERERRRAMLEESQAALAPTGSTVATRASQTRSGRAQNSAAFQAALYGTGSLTALSRRRLRNERPQVNLDTLGECVTSFGLSERRGAMGQWDIERQRTFLGPGSYAGAIESKQESGFARYGCAASTAALAAAEVLHASAPANAVAIQSGGVVIGGGGGGGGAGGDGASAFSASLVASKLNYTPLPSGLRAPTRDGLASVPKCVLENPGPAAYRPKHSGVEAHVHGVRMVPPRERALLEALRGAGNDLALASPPPPPPALENRTGHGHGHGHGLGTRIETATGADGGAAPTVPDSEAAPTAAAAAATETDHAPLPHGHKRSSSTRRRGTHRAKAGQDKPAAPRAHRPNTRGAIEEHVADEGAGALRGYFAEGERSLGLAPTKTPGPGSYDHSGGDLAGGGGAAAVLPSLAPFGSTAKRGVGVQGRGLNRDEMDAMVSPRERLAAAKRASAPNALPAATKAPARTGASATAAATGSSQSNNSSSSDSAKPTSEEQKESQVQSSDATAAAAAAAVATAAATTSAPQLAALIRAQRARASQLEWAASHASGAGSEAGAEAGDRSAAALRRFLLHQAQTAPVDGGPAKAAAVAAELAKDLPPPPGASLPRETGPTPAQERQWLAEARRAAMRDKVVRLGAERAERLALIEERASHIAHRSLRALSLQRWLALLVHASFIRQCHAVHTGRQSVLREMEAALRIQESWATFRARRAAQHRFATLRARLRNCMLHYVISRRIRRKRAAAALVGRFLVDHVLRKNQKMFRVLHHFKACVLRIQRAWRRWAAKHRASLEVNLAHWERTLHEHDALTGWMERRGLPAITGGAGAGAGNRVALLDPSRSRVRQDTAASSLKKRAPSVQIHPGGPSSSPALAHKHNPSLSTLSETAPGPSTAAATAADVGGAAAGTAIQVSAAPPTPSSAAHARGNSGALASAKSQGQVPGAAGTATAAATTKVQYFNQLKEAILEKLHERRVRLEAEEKRRAALQALTAAAASTTATSSRGAASGGVSLVGSRRASGVVTPAGRGGFALALSPAHSPSASPPSFAAAVATAATAAAQPAPLELGLTASGGDILAGEWTGPTWAAEREAYRAVFLLRPRRTAASSPNQARKGDTGIISGGSNSSGVSTAELAALSPLQVYVLRAHGPALENRPLPRGKVVPLPLVLGAPSDVAADATRTLPSSPSPLPPQQGSASVPASPRARLPSPKGRKPLYVPPRQSTLVLPSPSAAAAAAALELGLSCPRNAVHKSAQRALRDAQRRQEARLALDAVAELDDEGDDDAIVKSGRPAAQAAADAATTAATATSASDPPPLSWHGMVVSESIKVQLLRQALREARHKHWRLLSSYRRTLDAFLSSKLSSSESSLERARLFLTGHSAKLLSDQREYARAHPVPRLSALLPRPLMRALIVQGHLDQAEALDALALRRQELMRLIQAAPVPHHVPDLFGSAREKEREKEKERERENAGRRSGPVSPRSSSGSSGQNSGCAGADEAASPPAARKYAGLRNLNSTLLPSPVRLLRMQQKQAQAEADARVQGLASGGSSSNSGAATPLLQHQQHQQQHRQLVLDQLRRGRLVAAPSRPRSPSATSATFLAMHVAPPVADPEAAGSSEAQASTAVEADCATVPTDAAAVSDAKPSGGAESPPKEGPSAPEEAQSTAEPAAVPAASELSAILYSLATNSSQRFGAAASAGADRAQRLTGASGSVSAAGAVAVGMGAGAGLQAPRRLARPSHGRKPTMEAAALFRHRHPLLPLHAAAAPANQPTKGPVAPATVAPPLPIDPHPQPATVLPEAVDSASVKEAVDAAAAAPDNQVAP